MKTEPGKSTAWSRLAATARQVAAAECVQMPAGFATRVVAVAFARIEPPLSALFARFAWKACGLAALLMLATVAVNLGTVVRAIERDDKLTAAAVVDPVGEYLGVSVHD